MESCSPRDITSAAIGVVFIEPVMTNESLDLNQSVDDDSASLYRDTANIVSAFINTVGRRQDALPYFCAAH